MGMRSRVALASLAIVWSAALQAQTSTPPAGTPARYGIGRPATPADIAARDIDITPDGHGLPAGRGTPAEGAALYATKCAKCHGATGREGPNDPLVGRDPKDFSFSTDVKAVRTIGNYWPYPTTVFDYIRRAMPPDAPGSLTDAEVYALSAHLFHLNDLIPATAVMDATSLPKVAMPAKDRFKQPGR